ncbi:hypothetical protein JKP88DRAFT_262128 [Tribonema minus]|uniref:Uncharacterized protein n=1 Tax=Tribonema minus TaxID=303371 RepID=A0A835ZCY7_9STRA|nr:hypothetical protein JKP88DRAFT_262128 [Tribonema minus]
MPADATEVAVAAKVGAALFLLVPYAGISAYYEGGAADQWNMIIGGDKAPLAAFKHTADATTAYAQSRLMLNFVIDVGGYGVLGFLVAYKLWTEASLLFYLFGTFIIGIVDLAFLFLMVWPGRVIVFSPESLGGPVIRALAVMITPFGLPAFTNAVVKAKSG